MLDFFCRTSPDGVPILSRDQIDDLALQILYDYDPTMINGCKALDVEDFMENYLHLTPDYQYLSHNGSVLGMMVFRETDRIPVYDPETKRAEYIHADADTVLIDRRMLERNDQIHRYRYTVSHECSHKLLHSDYYLNGPLSISSKNLVLCRDNSRNRKPYSQWTAYDWIEWQANSLASALLLPYKHVCTVFNKNKRYENRHFQIGQTVEELIHIFNVSKETAVFRLYALGLIDNNESSLMFSKPDSSESDKRIREYDRYFRERWEHEHRRSVSWY